jgi:hypothetical protein|tara:strand:+ start:288 stop:437 length:150 start_codon:yes stop_codon:yes gene_type:complete
MGVDFKMLNFDPFKLPTYSEWKESVEKFYKQYNKFVEDWYLDIKKNLDK